MVLVNYPFVGGPYNGREFETDGQVDYLLPVIEVEGQLFAIDDPAIEDHLSLGPDLQVSYRLVEGEYVYQDKKGSEFIYAT